MLDKVVSFSLNTEVGLFVFIMLRESREQRFQWVSPDEQKDALHTEALQSVSCPCHPDTYRSLCRWEAVPSASRGCCPPTSCLQWSTTSCRRWPKCLTISHSTAWLRRHAHSTGRKASLQLIGLRPSDLRSAGEQLRSLIRHDGFTSAAKNGWLWCTHLSCVHDTFVQKCKNII